MPGGDRTGPMGAGPMTGRGFGFCNGFGNPGYVTPARGFRMAGRWGGFGRGRQFRRLGWGMPFGSGSYGPVDGSYGPAQQPSREEEIEMLQADAKEIKDTLQQINFRIDQLQKEKKRRQVRRSLFYEGMHHIPRK